MKSKIANNIKENYLYKDFIITEFDDNHCQIEDRKFKNLKKAILYVNFVIRRNKHFKWNRRKRNEVKMLTRKWQKLFEEN